MRRAQILCTIALVFACASPSRSKPALGFNSDSLGAMWDDAERCTAAVRAGSTLKKSEQRLRVGTWNIKWFPDGRPGKGEDGREGTDLVWLSCILAHLDVDIIALQELKLTPRGRAAQEEVKQRLQDLTGAPWAFEVDACGNPFMQHVGFLYRTDRVQISHPHTDPSIDPTETNAKEKDPFCPGNLRPALGVYVKSKAGGVDFHLVNVHLDSGEKQRDFGHRQTAWGRMGGITASRQAKVADDDILFVGDFNSMGCKKCGVATAADERTLLDKTLGSLSPPLMLAEAALPCSQYFKDQGTLLDQIAYSKAMREAYGASQRVSGLCGAAKCEKVITAQTPLLQRVSDHCPLVLDLADRDDD